MKIELTAGGVLGVAAVAALGYAAYKVATVDPNLINPASDKNLVNKAVTGIVGQENMATAGDYFFGAIDIINPWNESDEYALQVYGLDKVRNWVGL